MVNKVQEIELVLKRASEHLDWLRKYVHIPTLISFPRNRVGF